MGFSNFGQSRRTLGLEGNPTCQSRRGSDGRKQINLFDSLLMWLSKGSGGDGL
ncbi:hypothetical protein C1H46_004373 [Malus baccata]|uniref:Uncharacterized protein n=1 Tax=Malus baccata TaxID=106549 RepID=A0A540NHK7_MALBA|nr:hypothetical protein C1H46_004373 [Malus baccata]